MSLKERLINRHGFDADTFGFRFEADDAIDHEKRETMRQNLHHFIGIEPTIAARDCSRRGHSASSRLLAGDGAGEARIAGVTGPYCHHVAANASSDQSEVADDIENFVADEFVGEPQRFLA